MLYRCPVGSRGYKSASGTSGDNPAGGKLASIACSILMQLLYVARTVRPDLLHAIGHLACFLTCWTEEQDSGLHWLMRNVLATLHWRHISWVGDVPADVSVHLFCDADFAGDSLSMRSTNGLYLCLRGLGAGQKARMCFTLHAGSGDSVS